jgi:hypothetical protein
MAALQQANGVEQCPLLAGQRPLIEKEANESGRPAVEKLEPLRPGLVVIVAVRGRHLKGGLRTPHVPV